MKKILLLFYVAVCFTLQASAQSFTINNTTSCDFAFVCVGATPSCSQVDGFISPVTVTAGNSVSYSTISAAPWGSTPLPGLQWSVTQVQDCNGVGGPKVGPGQPGCVSSFPNVGTGSAPACGCSTYTLTRTVDAFGNVTVTIS